MLTFRSKTLLAGADDVFEAHFQTVFYNIGVKGAVGKVVGDRDFGDGQPVSVDIHDCFKQDVKRFTFGFF